MYIAQSTLLTRMSQIMLTTQSTMMPVFLSSPLGTFMTDIVLYNISKRISRLSDEYKKENPQVKQVWVQVWCLSSTIMVRFIVSSCFRRQCSRQKAGLSPITMYSNWLMLQLSFFFLKKKKHPLFRRPHLAQKRSKSSASSVSLSRLNI